MSCVRCDGAEADSPLDACTHGAEVDARPTTFELLKLDKIRRDLDELAGEDSSR